MNRTNSSRRTPRHAARKLRLEALEPRQLLATTTLTAAADTQIRFGIHEDNNFGNSAFLDIRQNDGAPRDFLSYVRFDLSSLNVGSISEASFNLTSTGGDFWTGGRFRIVGLDNVASNTPQDWNEDTLTWNSAGDEIDTSIYPNPNPTDSVLVASRTTNLDGSVAGVVETTPGNGNAGEQGGIHGETLIDFLQQRVDDNGLVTFIIDMPVNNPDRTIAFASREHDTSGWAPSLELTYEVGPPQPDAYPENPVVLPRQVENLDRGVIALRRASNQIYVGWRMLGTDPADVSFNLYRSVNGGRASRLNTTPLTQTTDYVDTTANLNAENAYFVRAVIGGIEQPASELYYLPASAPIAQHIDIPLAIPSGGTTPTGGSYNYSANDATVGDLDGDGDYEVILKWDPSNSKDNSQSGYTGNVYIDAYTLEGEMLWRIDLGRNIRAGAHYTQMLVYDLDGDGRSEVVLKTAPGTVDGQGNYVLLGRDDPNADYRNSGGYVLSGPEYLTVFDGLTGAELQSIPFPMERVSASTWGDSYGNRVDRFLSGVAYLDGNRPSIVWARGYYGPQSGFQARNEVVALDWRDGQLTQRWRFDAATNGAHPDYIAQGSNALAIADVDGDGLDEVIHGAAALDHDGTPLYSTGLGHGDALHVSDMDPSNPGLEVFMVHESPGAYESNGRDAGGELRDAQTGELLHQIPSNNDVGRGVAGDIDPNHVGYEYWATTNQGTRMIYNVSGEALYETPGNMMYNFLVWWDADLSRELLDGTTISEWHNPLRSNLVWYGANGINYNGNLASNNGTKSTPSLVADILGDWREEVIWRRSDNSALEIWSTTIGSTTRLPTLMHDLQYREAVAGQNVAYNQPSHPSYWIGEGMAAAPQPPLFFGGELPGDYDNSGTVDQADYTVWRDNLGSTTNLSADGDHNGTVDAGDFALWHSNLYSTATLTSNSPALLTAAEPTSLLTAQNQPLRPPIDVTLAANKENQVDTTLRNQATANLAGPVAVDDAALLLLGGESRETAEPFEVVVAGLTPDEAQAERLEPTLDAAFETWGEL